MGDEVETVRPLVLTPSQENYLEWIYRFRAAGPVKVRDVARKAGVRLPSVSRAVSMLKKAGLVEHDLYGLIDLTPLGRKGGEEIVLRDTCLTRLLVDVLGMSPAAADPAVHQMEHVLTDEVLGRLQVLVDFCLEAPAWHRRLALRMGRWRLPAAAPGRPLVGATIVHAGFAREKNVL
jgi:DtxR family Mn-dependent transcriptional regulator